MTFSLSDLSEGDEITIQPGYGFPAAAEVKTTVVILVRNGSILTSDGTLLGCLQTIGVTPTHRHFDTGQYSVSELAQSRLIEASQTPEALSKMVFRLCLGG